MPAKEANWIPVNSDELQISHTTVENGVEIKIGLSPYDIPQGIYGYLDSDNKTYVIDLKYMNKPQRMVEVFKSEKISIFGDPQTGLIHRVMIETFGKKAPLVRIIPAVSKEIDAASQRATLPLEKKRFDLLKQTIKSSAKSLQPT